MFISYVRFLERAIVGYGAPSIIVQSSNCVSSD